MEYLTKLAVALLLPSVVLAQVASPVSLSGTYRGDVIAPNTKGENAFKMVLTQNGNAITGTVQFWKAEPKCRQQVPLAGALGDTGIATIQALSVLAGCERTFTVQVTANGEVVGQLKGPLGLFDFKLVKE